MVEGIERAQNPVTPLPIIYVAVGEGVTVDTERLREKCFPIVMAGTGEHINLMTRCDALLLAGDCPIEEKEAQSIGMLIFRKEEDLAYSWKPMHWAFRTITDKMFHLFRGKQDDYGPLSIAITGVQGITVRIWDKVARLLQQDKKVHEPVEDTLLDLANYSVMSMIYRAGLWK